MHADIGFKLVSAEAGPRMLRFRGWKCRKWAALGTEVQAVERRADRAYRVEVDEESFVVYQEAYTCWNADIWWDVFGKSGLLSQREKLPTVTFVLLLRPDRYQKLGPTRCLSALGRPWQQLWIEEVRLWEEVPQPWWEESAGLMALYPLSCHGRSGPEALAHAAQLIAAHARTRKVRADMLTVLGVYGKLRYPELDVFHLIGRAEMKESKFYQEIMVEGRVEELRSSVKEALLLRFGRTEASKFEDRIAETNQLSDLRRLHRLAIQSDTIDAFGRELARVGRGEAKVARRKRK